MIALAPGYPDEDVPRRKQDLRPVAEAAELVGVHEMTVWRYLRIGLLERHKSAPGAPRVTKVDLLELRRLRGLPVEDKGDG